ncbi:hypothetical protein FQN52_001241 [Onygenales sp. PD_12]|nr:hypothetical protein FQN52_001241 [Onygenales sp. PD_12]
MATTLPPELIQSIYLFTDPETFHSARQTCTSWHQAASSPYVLKKQLQRTPLPALHPQHEPSSQPTPTTPAIRDMDWSALFNHLAFANLFGKRDHIQKTVLDKLPPSTTRSLSPPTIATSGDGTKCAVLRGSYLELYDTNHGSMHLKLGRSLYPMWTSVVRAMCSSMTGSSMGVQGTYQLALSDRGDILAVALGSTVHVYDLSGSAQEEQWPVEFVFGGKDGGGQRGNVGTGAEEARDGGVIQSVEFVEGDLLLRVGLANNGGSWVQYLGNPPPCWGECRVGGREGVELMEYWRSNIDHVYLDSIALAQSLGSGGKTSLGGLQLLPSTAEGQSSRMFVARLQQDGEGWYCIGSCFQGAQANILKKLPRKRDGTSDPSVGIFNPVQFGGMPPASKAQNLKDAKSRWNLANMPPVTSSQPMMAVSGDGMLLAVYEPGAGHQFSFANGGAIYIYNLQHHMPAKSIPIRTPTAVEESPISQSSGELPAWPFLLDVVDDHLFRLRVLKEQVVSGDGMRTAYVVAGETSKDILQWRIV